LFNQSPDGVWQGKEEMRRRMIIGVPREVHPREIRVALIPEHVAKLSRAGAQILVESGTGRSLNIPDEAYRAAGAKIVSDRKSMLENADLSLSIRPPSPEEVLSLRHNAVYISLMDPFREKNLIGSPYDQLFELDVINDDFKRTDVSVVVGANDVVNPAAKNMPGSPIYGMPILNVDHSKAVIVLKRSMNPGFSGIENQLFVQPNTMMVFGDAKKTLAQIAAAVKSEG